MKNKHILLRVDDVVGRVLRVFSICCLVALTLLLAINIFSRATGLFGMNWFDEVVATVFAWLVFIGSCALWRERDHFAISLLSEALAGKRIEGYHRVAISLFGLLFAAVLMFYGARFVGRTSSTTPVLELPQAWAYACMPVAGFLMTVYALRDVWTAVRDAAAGRFRQVPPSGTELMAAPASKPH